MPPPQSITARYDVVTEQVRAGSYAWSLLAVRDTNLLVDAISPAQFEADEQLPYWADVWASSVAMARALRERPGLCGSAVLELGCGLGLAGIAAAQAGAAVTMTDYEPDAVEFSRYNAAVNLTPEERARVSFRMLDWHDTEAAGTFDLVIGADIVYDRQNFAALVSCARRNLRPGGSFLVADPGRSIGRDFMRLAAGEGFRLSERSVAVTHRGRDLKVTLADLVRGEAA